MTSYVRSALSGFVLAVVMLLGGGRAHALDLQVEADFAPGVQIMSLGGVGYASLGFSSVRLGALFSDRVSLVSGVQFQHSGRDDFTSRGFGVPVELAIFLGKEPRQGFVPSLRLGASYQQASYRQEYAQGDGSKVTTKQESRGFGARALAGANYFFTEGFGVSVQTGLAFLYSANESRPEMPYDDDARQLVSESRIGLVLRTR